jgi:glutamate dehydrogenase/leucine dehydrogenase
MAERNPNQPEYMQAVTEVVESLWPFITQHQRYAEHGLLDRLVEPERVIIFRVSWSMIAAKCGLIGYRYSTALPLTTKGGFDFILQ